MTEPRIMKAPTRRQRVSVEQAKDFQLISLKSLEFSIGNTLRKCVRAGNMDYIVVGIVGGPNVGKSAILNYLCELSDQEDNASYLPPFKQATQKVVDSGEHTTQGVDLRISGKRVIALDTPPIGSPSILLELLTNASPAMELARRLSVAALRGARPPKASSEALYKIMSLQITTFLLCVCHVVLFVFDGPQDQKIFELLNAAELFAIDILSAATENGPLADAIFVCSNLPEEKMTKKNIEQMKAEFDKQTSASKLRRHSRGRGSVDGREDGTGHVERSTVDTEVASLRRPMPWSSFFALPEPRHHGSDLGQTNDFESHLTDLKRTLLTLKQRKQNALCEQSWLNQCQGIWDAIWKSKLIAEYYFALQETLYKDGGGW